MPLEAHYPNRYSETSRALRRRRGEAKRTHLEALESATSVAAAARPMSKKLIAANAVMDIGDLMMRDCVIVWRWLFFP